MSSGLPLSLVAVAGLAGLGLAVRHAGSQSRLSPQLALIDAMLVNPNLDAICDLAVLIARYPNPSKPERGIIQKNARRMAEIREGEACVLLDALTDQEIAWQLVGRFVQGPAPNVAPPDLGFDFQIDAVPDGWVRDALESADAAIAAGRAASARVELSPFFFDLRAAIVARDHAACAERIRYWRLTPSATPEEAHVTGALIEAARVLGDTSKSGVSREPWAREPWTRDPVSTAWCAAGNAAAHARLYIGVTVRNNDRIRCYRRLLLRAMLVAPPGSITQTDSP